MAENRNRVPISVLLAGLVELMVVAMVVDRRAMLRGGRDLSGWSWFNRTGSE